MKKILFILFTVFLNMVVFSCSPESIADNGKTGPTDPVADCCGDDNPIPPPPPPPGG